MPLSGPTFRPMPLTDDMQHGSKFGSLTVVNPFIESVP
jgi:predicted nucleic acid-binding protein